MRKQKRQVCKEFSPLEDLISTFEYFPSSKDFDKYSLFISFLDFYIQGLEEGHTYFLTSLIATMLQTRNSNPSFLSFLQ